MLQLGNGFQNRLRRTRWEKSATSPPLLLRRTPHRSRLPPGASAAPIAAPAVEYSRPQRLQLESGACHSTRLLHLSIQDFALVDEQHVVIGPGFNALTGESGSGKSVLVSTSPDETCWFCAWGFMSPHVESVLSGLQVEALGLLLGAPAPPDCVRPPATAAQISGVFWLNSAGSIALRNALDSQGLPPHALPPTNRPSQMEVHREVMSKLFIITCCVNGDPQARVSNQRFSGCSACVDLGGLWGQRAALALTLFHQWPACRSAHSAGPEWRACGHERPAQ